MLLVRRYYWDCSLCRYLFIHSLHTLYFHVGSMNLSSARCSVDWLAGVMPCPHMLLGFVKDEFICMQFYKILVIVELTCKLFFHLFLYMSLFVLFSFLYHSCYCCSCSFFLLFFLRIIAGFFLRILAPFLLRIFACFFFVFLLVFLHVFC